MKCTKLLLTTVALSAVCAETSAAKRSDKPNVILIMCDDLGWGDVGFNGNTTILTPHLDKMASEGIQLNRFYTASAVSSPTRMSCLTGRNPFRCGVFNANAGILRPEEITIPELLKEQGYVTGHFGKWHLGSLTYTERDANRGREGNTRIYNPPRLHGYDEAFVTESKVPTWDPMIAPATKRVSKTGWNYIKEGEASKPFGTSYWDIDGVKVTDNLDGDDSRIIMDRVIPFIESSQGDPFFAAIWFHAPHKPCVAGAEYAALYEGHNNNFKNYAGCVTAMDEQVGRLREYLIQESLYDNTIIWFCSDNGPENCIENGGGVTGGFKDRKRSLYEGGVRVPAYVVWPKVIKSEIESNIPTSTIDYLPTIAAIAGVEIKDIKYEIDGIDLTPLLKGEMKRRDTPIITSYVGQKTYTDDNYKLYILGDKVELYDIVNDPYETTPIDNPAKVEEFTSAIDRTIESYRKSFEGEEYGTLSHAKLEQSWNMHSRLFPDSSPKSKKQ